MIAGGQPAEALRVISALPGGDQYRLAYEAIASVRLGDRAASDRALAQLVRRYSVEAQYQIADVHAQRDEADEAFAAIDRAWNLADPGLLELKTDPMFTPLRADARFAGWVRKIGFF